ncbi:citrate synthase/methylcitrate synthase [Enemella dayhoffiae]|uniref:Citrate synthase n=2 Tax=Enemella dayhoffiae TaxID=2016507 RepID=A0A255GZ12_9ACTN|nr:citrate synthase/methylcitrate synthase [Enemella dayhoffiae]
MLTDSRAMTQIQIAPPGLKNVVVADTELGDVRGGEGFYHYREYDAIDLARSRSFTEVWHLLFVGHLPDPAELTAFEQEIAAARTLPEPVRELLPTVARAGRDRHALARLRTALSLLGAVDGFEPAWGADPERLRREAIRVAAVTPTLLAAMHRLRAGEQPIPPRPELSTAADWLWQLTGSEPDPQTVAAIERYLVCTIDHGFNASTFTARVITSAGSDVASAVCGALGAFAGPLHGGAPDRALDALDEIGEASRARDWVRQKVADGDRIMGFGHAVYRTADPRAMLLRETALELGGELVELAVAVEQEVVAALAELKPGRELYANVEFYAGVVMERCGLPRELFTPTFAVARVVGWGANVLEQNRSSKIFRPSARYVGRPAPQPVPVRSTAG